jgi:hypothetical protein
MTMNARRIAAALASGCVCASFACGSGGGGSSSSPTDGGAESASKSDGDVANDTGTGATDAHGGEPGKDGATGGDTGGSEGSEGGAGNEGGADGSAPGSATCTNPAYTLALDPSNPQYGITLSGFYVDTDTWNAANYAVTQTIYVCDYGNWYVVANMNDDAHDGAVKTYPDVHMDFPSAPAVSSFASIASTFAHAGPHVGIYEYAYDMWLNGVAASGSTEIMIWTDNFHQVPAGTKMETVTLGGQTYDVYEDGSYIAFVDETNVTSGTLDLLSFFQHVIAKGWVPSTSTLGAIDYGVELVSTGGADATFQVNAFTLTTQ